MRDWPSEGLKRCDLALQNRASSLRREFIARYFIHRSIEWVDKKNIFPDVILCRNMKDSLNNEICISQALP